MRKQITEQMLFEDILPKMFSYVGLSTNPNNIKRYVKRPRWFCLKTWSDIQEWEFQMWLKEYMKSKLNFSEKRASYEAGYFVTWYGWKIKGNLIIWKK